MNQLLNGRNFILDELKWQVSQAQNRMKLQADKRRRELEFIVGDMVYLKVQP